MKNKVSLAFFAILLFVNKLYAQVPPPPEFEEHGPGPGGRPAPIDEPIIFLSMIAVLIGIVYIIKKRKEIAK